MSTVIVYTNPLTGSMCLCTPTGDVPFEVVKSKDCPAGRLIEMPSTNLPVQDADFFDAWEIGEFDRIIVNLDKAKQITKQRLRRERAPLLAQLDIDVLRSQESRDATFAIHSIIAEKNRLRNITALVNNCTTLQELRALKA